MFFSSPPVQRSKSLSEQTYQSLRASILSGELASGDRLIEAKIAQQLQVSRTPIREAIRQLQREGLITPDAGGGLRVTVISVEDVNQLYDCRLALERLSAAGACAHASAAQLSQIEACVRQAEILNSHPLRDDDYLQRLELDYQFHHLIAEGSGNKWLVTLLDQVFDKMALMRIQTTRHNPDVLEIRLEHRQIYEAIARRDSADAVFTIEQHLVSSKARVNRAVEHLHNPG